MDRRPETQFGGTLASVLLVLGAVAVLAVMTLYTLAAVKHERVVRSWEPTIGTLESFLERYPKTEANATALEIERIAGDLGVDIVPRHLDDRPRPDKDNRDRFSQIKKQVFGKRWLQRGLEQPRIGKLETPPKALVTFLAEHDDTLRELRSTLSGGVPAPAWSSDLAMLWEAPIQNLLGHIDLVKLMSSAALVHARAGDETTALQYAEAIWWLAHDLRDSPILINQLILIAETRMLAGVLRHFDDVPDLWFERLEADYRAGFLEAMKYEGWVWLHIDPTEVTGDSVWQKLARPVVEPFATYGIADISGDWRERIVNLEQVESICDYDLSARHADLNIPVPRWNYFGQTFVPNLANATYRVSRLELDLELTRMTLEAKRALREGVALPQTGPIPSRACSADSWRASVADGELQITFSREIHWDDQVGAVLPTRTLMRLQDSGNR